MALGRLYIRARLYSDSEIYNVLAVGSKLGSSLLTVLNLHSYETMNCILQTMDCC